MQKPWIGVLVVLLAVACLVIARSRSGAAPDLQVEDLCVPSGGSAADDLLEDWRWKVGKDARVFHVTLFGDIFTEAPGGAIYRLDTATAAYVQAAGDKQQFEQAAKAHLQDWFHAHLVQELRAHGVSPKADQVYSWRKPPLLGGSETADNVDLLPLEVHVSNAGRLAEAAKDLPPGAKIGHVNFQVAAPAAADRFEVVINAEEQYSMWPVGQDPPAGWKKVGKNGTQGECLQYIKTVWTDMRPRSQREKPPR